MRIGWFYPGIVVVAAIGCVSAIVYTKDTSMNKTDKTAQEDVDVFVPYMGERFGIFDWNLLQKMIKSQDGNLLISPISLKLALVLLYEGAQDETAQQLANVMHLPVGKLATREKFTNILKSLQTRMPEYALNLGTRMFIDKGVATNERYTTITKSYYGTDVASANFSDGRSTTQMINDFINNVTDGRIPTIVDDERSLKENAILIASGIFFKGTWYRQPFAVNETKVDNFYLTDEKTVVRVPYLRASTRFYLTYSEELDAKILRLPYAGHKFAMFLVLPQGRSNLDVVVERITPTLLNRHMWQMQEVSVDVAIPKLKFDFTCHLEKHLRELGIRDIFDDTATLTGILHSRTASRTLKVSDVVQRSGIELDEHGTLAASATKIEIGNKINDETFHANKPFLFYIEDESTGTILHMGLVRNPLEQNGTAESSEASARMVEASPVTTGESAMMLSERQNYFNIELLQGLNKDKLQNVVVGTTSIRAALIILAEAAAGRTQMQLRSTLRLSMRPSDWRESAMHALVPFKDAKSNTELQTAVKLWTSKGVTVKSSFRNIIQWFYKGNLESVNFTNLEETVKIVNNWAKNRTHGEIESIVDQNSLTSDTRVLLTTVVYFKGVWQNAFDANSTRLSCFNVPGHGCQEVPMMESVHSYKYADVPALNAEVIEIPYTGERVSMMVILPKRGDEEALADLSRDLTFMPISSIRSVLETEEVELHLPKFRMNNKMDLRSNLEQLGIKDLFDENANLTTAFPDTPVQVSSVMHNAQIEVNEEGTIAAAATAASVIPLMGGSTTVFRADRPFIFLLMDLYYRDILFAGRFVKP